MLITNGTPPAARAPRLTDREMRIVFLMGAGNSSPEIAAQLGLSPRTVENRKRLIYEKLGVGSQGQAVAEAVRSRAAGRSPEGGHSPGAAVHG